MREQQACRIDALIYSLKKSKESLYLQVIYSQFIQKFPLPKINTFKENEFFQNLFMGQKN